jgi:hypothetical protein
VIVRYDGRTWCGSVADLRDSGLDSGDALAAVRGETSPCAVHCPTPGQFHDRVGHVHPAMGLKIRTALADAARSRGAVPPQDEKRARLQDRRDAIDVAKRPPQRSDAPAADAQSLQERVAQLRGRVTALEECGRDASDERAKLRETAARLSEIETTRLAAEEYRDQTRADRDRRERRMTLEDRIANLERGARAHLVERYRERYERALFALAPTADPFDADPVAAALALLRIGSVDAPVVLTTTPLASPAATAAWIEAPVILCGECE